MPGFFIFFFCSTSLPLASTRWVRSTIKPFMHCPHTKQCIAVNKSLRHQEIRNSKSEIRKYLGNAENRTRAGWVRSANATSVLCRPPYLRIFLLMLLRFMDWIESGQRLDNVNGTHLVLASGKLVLQKNKKVPDKTQQGTWWML